MAYFAPSVLNSTQNVLRLESHGSLLPFDSLPHPPRSPFQAALSFIGDLDEDEASRWSSFIGIIVAISGNILISLALNVQKYAHIRLDKEERRQQLQLRKRRQQDTLSRRSSASDSTDDGIQTRERGSSLTRHADQKYLKSRLWWSGLVLMCIGECGNFLAYGFASASIVSPLGVVALISNCIIAPVLLKEPFRGQDYLGVIVSIAGAVVVVFSSASEEVKLGPDEILKAISQTAFEVYFGVVCVLIGVLMYLSRRWGRKLILIDLGLVALFGGFTVLSTKAISSLLSSSFYHIVTMPIAYLFIFVLILTAVMQVKYLNRALQRFDSTQVIPIQFVLFTLSVIVGSAILYRDFEKIDHKRLVRFIIGCALTFSGVYLISSGRISHESPLEQEETESTAEEDNRIIHRHNEDREVARSSDVLVSDDDSEEDDDETEPLLQSEERDIHRAIKAVVAPLGFERRAARDQSMHRSGEVSIASSLQRNALILMPPIVTGYQLQAVAGELVATRESSRRPSIRRHNSGDPAGLLEPDLGSSQTDGGQQAGSVGTETKWTDRLKKVFGK